MSKYKSRKHIKKNKRSSKSKRMTKRITKRKRSSSKRSSKTKRMTKRIRRKRLHGGQQVVQPPAVPLQQPMPATTGDKSQNQVAGDANAHNNLNTALRGGGRRLKKQRGGDIARCQTSLTNGPNGYGYTPQTGCIGPVPSAMDSGAQEGLIIAAYNKAVGLYQSTYDKT